MEKRVVVELDEDGVVVSVYCPDETYIVDLLDHAARDRDWETVLSVIVFSAL